MTDPAPRFCSACGTQLVPGDTFCSKCGTRIEQPATPAPAPVAVPEPTPVPSPAPAPQAAASGEPIIAVIGNLTHATGFMGVKQKTYTLVITDRRLIFALLSKEKITGMVNQARDEAKAAGKGFFGQWGAQIGTSFNYHEGYWQMAPEAILAEESDNFAVDRSAFKSAKFKAGIMDDEHNTPDMVIVKTTSETYKLQVNGSLGAVKEAFRTAGLA